MWAIGCNLKATMHFELELSEAAVLATNFTWTKTCQQKGNFWFPLWQGDNTQ
jgi:hypothetical protein